MLLGNYIVSSKAQSFSANANELDSRGAAGILQLNRKNNYKEWIQGKAGVNNNRLGNQANDEANTIIENNHFKIYPNPSAGMFYYEYNVNETNTDATLTVIDMMGKTIINGTVNTTNAKGMINLSELPNGIYFISISNGTKQLFTSKLSVVK